MATSPARKKDNPTETPTIHMLKKATCNNLAASARLTYNIGADDSGTPHFKIVKNSGNGFFNSMWISFDAIQQAFADWPVDTPFTSYTLQPLFQGKSVNNSSFLLAVLKAEQLVEPVPDRKRTHRECDPRAFLDSVQQLTKKHRTPAKPKPKAARKAATRMPKGGKKTTSKK